MTGLFAFTLFVSSFLMFSLEPMIAKMFLPHFGGAPAVWNTCLVFFQMALLAGYAFAHGGERLLGSKRQALLYAAVVVGAGLTLPFSVVAPGSMTEQTSIAWLFAALAGAIGLPFFALAATASSLQKWFAHTDHPGARDPYFLYAASNAGSLAGLLAYPSIVEPTLALSSQRSVWAAGYLLFALVAIGCAATTIFRRRSERSLAGPAVEIAAGNLDRPESLDPAVASDAITNGRRLTWIAFSFVPSSLLVGVTTLLSTDITPVPLLWIGPLGLYLLTFVLAFGMRSARLVQTTKFWVPPLVCLFAVAQASGAGLALWMALPLHLTLFTGLALACHGQLASDRPSPKHLTEFYLWVSVGGMFGGLFNALVAPVLFDSLVEYPLVIVCACAVGALAGGAHRAWRFTRTDLLFPLAVGTVTAVVMVIFELYKFRRLWIVPALIIPAMAAFSQRRKPVRFALAIGAILLLSSRVDSWFDRTLLTDRTFFGMYKVISQEAQNSRHLLHGTTLHGAQSLDPARASEPLTYYSTEGPIGQAFQSLPQLTRPGELAVVGLGVGSLSAYARPGQKWTFYEIDPAVERIARNDGLFTFLKVCGGQCQVVIGDARLSLQHARPGQYSLIVLDAFSSDAIPMHLMTREAVDLYVSRLAPDGIIAFHVSNRHLSLSPIVARIATAEHLVALEQTYIPNAARRAQGATGSRWVLLAHDSGQLEALKASGASGPSAASGTSTGWTVPKTGRRTPLWTDDFSNILSAVVF